MNKYMRIKIIGDKSYLVYDRGLIYDMEIIDMEIIDVEIIDKKYKYHKYGMGPLSRAYQYLCNNINNIREANKSPKIDPMCQKHIKAVNNIKKSLGKVSTDCFEPKKPVTPDRYVGIEIECFGKTDQDTLAEAFAGLKLSNKIMIQDDGSITPDTVCDGTCMDGCECSYCNELHYCNTADACRARSENEGYHSRWKHDTGCWGHRCQGYDDHPDYECTCECTCGVDKEKGCEITVLCKTSEVPDTVKKICKVLNNHSMEVNSSCGLHVHLDARNANVKKMFKNLVDCQDLLYDMVPKSRKKNTYCLPNKTNNFDTCKDGKRYLGVNPTSYDRHGTIEVRLHAGTTNATKIINWVQILQRIAYAKIPEKVSNVNDLTKIVKLSNKLRTYVIKRVDEFSEQRQAA